MPPNIPMPTMTLAMIVTTAGRMVKSFSGISAASRMTASATTKSTSPTAAVAKQTIERVESQPQPRPCSRTVRSGIRQTHRETAPIQSILEGRRTWWTCSVL